MRHGSYCASDIGKLSCVNNGSAIHHDALQALCQNVLEAVGAITKELSEPGHRMFQDNHMWIKCIEDQYSSCNISQQQSGSQ